MPTHHTNASGHEANKRMSLYLNNETFARKIKEEIEKLKPVEFIYEIEHTKWVSLIVIVPKTTKNNVCVST